MNKKLGSVTFIGSILGIVSYISFSLIAYIAYPFSFSPIENWLSDLGNLEINMCGAVFYNIGIVVTASFLVIFFLGFSRWKVENKKIQVIMVLLTQIFGIVGLFCMIMSAVFPINVMEIHRIWSMSLYFMLATSFVFSAAALRYHPMVPRWLLILGITTAVMVNLTIFLPKVYLLEWITVILFLGYVGLVGVHTRRATQQS